ncbi:MAG: response regulator [Spirochaetaceae bacterium 4572_59]|nr:MAG: response regulator [Spirochaetaceae bacterium 4572_59]
MCDIKEILVVEDEDAIRLTLRDYLLRKGYSVSVASDGVGAIKLLLDKPEIRIIVTDYRMEIFGGDYWIKFLKQYCSDKEVIVTSGFLRPEFTIPYKVFYKPYDYAELEEALSEIFSHD